MDAVEPRHLDDHRRQRDAQEAARSGRGAIRFGLVCCRPRGVPTAPPTLAFVLVQKQLLSKLLLLLFLLLVVVVVVVFLAPGSGACFVSGVETIERSNLRHKRLWQRRGWLCWPSLLQRRL
jgi:hypothetical protein